MLSSLSARGSSLSYVTPLAAPKSLASLGLISLGSGSPIALPHLRMRDQANAWNVVISTNSAWEPSVPLVLSMI